MFRWTGPAGGPSASRTTREASDRAAASDASSGTAKIGEPADGRAEEAGLARWSAALPRAVVRGADRPCTAASGTRPLVGLDVGGMQLGGRGAARGQHDARPAGCGGQAERREGGRPLVMVDVHA